MAPNVTPMNEAAAEQQLREEYKRVMGVPPDEMAGMICRISAARALSGEKWKWVKDEANPNWSAQLHWG
jgi:hypothetical protein